MDVEHKLERALEPKPITVQERDYSVMLSDCDCHEFDIVVLQLETTLGCSEIQASHFARVAEQFGSVCVFKGPIDACNGVAYELSKIKLEVEVE